MGLTTDIHAHAHAHAQLLSPEDVARFCGLSRRAVYDVIRRGEIPAMRLCGRLRIRPEDVDAWLGQSAVNARQPQRVAELRRPTPSPSQAGSFRGLMAAGGKKAAR